VTKTVDRAHAMEDALVIAYEAAKLIRVVYGEEFDVHYKGPQDPVTRADREANAWIVQRLSSLDPRLPIVAEESEPSTFAGFEKSPCAWFVDPLDGTREFVAKNGEFCVMIGLAEKGRATVGAIVWPALGRAFVGAEGVGAFQIDNAGTRSPMHVSSIAKMADAQILVSRSHRTEESEAAIAKLGVKGITYCGSAGVKAMKVACGEAELYVQPGVAGARWDTCAPEAILRAAGGELTDVRGRPIDYLDSDVKNRNGFLVTNGSLHREVIDKLALYL
jgi:3'(2'), 5'-bisphosphate nucleotidase